MMRVSNTFREILKLGPEFHVGADVVLKNGTTLNLKESDFMVGTFNLIDSTSSDKKLEVGSVAAQQFKVSLNNFYNKFTDSQFEGAVIKPYIDLVTKMDWHGPATERCNRGQFTISGPKSVGGTIQLSALDNMSKFDQPYSKSTLVYPKTLGEIVADACSCCGVTLATTAFTNSTYVVTSRPTDGALTFRDVISYAGQLSGNFCRCNVDGALELRWYDFTKFSLSDTDENRPWDIIGIESSDIKKADTVVTGVKITGNDEAKTIYKSGTDGFVISISNPFVQDGVQSLADTLGSKLVGMTLRPFTAQACDNPAIEAGDVCYITDPDGNKYKSIVSNLAYTIGESESYSGDAESADDNSATYYSPAAKAQETANVAQQTADNASKEVELAKVSIGNLEIRVTATEKGLESKVSTADLGTDIQQHASDILLAFNSASGSKSVKITGDGFDFYNGSTYIGHRGVSSGSIDDTLADGKSMQWNSERGDYSMSWHPYDDGLEGGFHCGNIYPAYVNMKGGNIMNVGVLKADSIFNASGQLRVGDHVFMPTRFLDKDGNAFIGLLESVGT
ncbi:MAG TPA: hypothetical protein VHP31_12320 [Caproicibacter sp.]|nr:hypothetical protein [Caproicibacter sp.]